MNRKLIPLILVSTALLALSACNLVDTVTGSGNVISREFDFEGFNEVSIGHAFDATINQGTEYSVVVRIDDNLADSMVAEQVDNRVNIGLESGTIPTRATLEVEITMPRLAWLNASGASQVQLNQFEMGDLFIADASGASRIHGDIDAVDLELTASGASSIFLAGVAANVQADASGASTIDLTELSAVDAQTKASGASNITVNIDGILDADASGASTISYMGNVEMGDIKTSGGSNVQPR